MLNAVSIGNIFIQVLDNCIYVCLDITEYQIYVICMTSKNLETNINQNLNSKKIELPKWTPSLYFLEVFLIYLEIFLKLLN